ncbi:MAG TPA: hypothetical protein VEC93_01645 [Anaerolineae bacterium]|nr:hypothetical protein [Anaerolineae bacterium]
MIVIKYSVRLGIVFTLWVSAGLLVACGVGGVETPSLPPIDTKLLVRAPDAPLPVNKSIEVISRSDASEGVSHVELYAVELPTGEKEVLIRSDAAPTHATTFTTSQDFIPRQAGHYVIKVVGYNRLGQSSTSNFIGFDVQ